MPGLPQTQPAQFGQPQAQPSQPIAWSSTMQPATGSTRAAPPPQMGSSGPTAYPNPVSSAGYPAPSYPPTQLASGAYSPYPTPTIASGANYPPVPGPFNTMPNTPPPPQKGTMGRRNLLIAGGAAAVVLVGGGALATSILSKNGGLTQKQKVQVTPTPIPGPQQLIQGIPLLVLSGHNAGVTVAAWHSQGRYLASGGSDGNVMLWDITSYLKQSTSLQTITTPLNKWKFADEIFRSSLSWSANGQLLAVTISGDTNKINIIEPFTKKAPYAYTRKATDAFDDSSFGDVAWSPTGDMLASNIFFEGDISLFDTHHTTNPFKTLKSTDIDPQTNKPYDTTTPAWSLDGRYLAGQTADFKVLVWDVKTGNILQTLALPSRSNKNFVIAENIQQWSPQNAGQLAVVNLDAVQTWDALQNKPLLTLGTNDPGPLTIPPNAPDGWVPHMLGMAWSPNARYIAGGYARSNLVYIWDTKNLTPSKTKDNLHVQNLSFGSNGHSQAISNLAWSPDGKYIATTSSDKTIIIWKVDNK